MTKDLSKTQYKQMLQQIASPLTETLRCFAEKSMWRSSTFIVETYANIINTRPQKALMDVFQTSFELP